MISQWKERLKESCKQEERCIERKNNKEREAGVWTPFHSLSVTSLMHTRTTAAFEYGHLPLQVPLLNSYFQHFVIFFLPISAPKSGHTLRAPKYGILSGRGQLHKVGIANRMDASRKTYKIRQKIVNQHQLPTSFMACQRRQKILYIRLSTNTSRVHHRTSLALRT